MDEYKVSRTFSLIFSLIILALCVFILLSPSELAFASQIIPAGPPANAPASYSSPLGQPGQTGLLSPDCTPRIYIRKQADGPDLRTFTSGSDVTFEIFVKNTGDVALTNVAVTDEQAPGCAKTIGSLAVGASYTYNCTVSGVTEGFTNVAKAEGYYGSTRVTDEDPSTVKIARIDLRKQAEGPDSRLFASGADVTFEIFVQNTGEVALTNVAVTDALAPGCAKSIGSLAVGASATYTCTLSGVTEGFTNVAAVEGWFSCSGKVTDQDPSTVQIAQTPQIDIRKQAEGADTRVFASGSDVTFEIFVQNTGNMDLSDVAVTDALAPGCAKSIGSLAAGASTTYSCTVQNVTEGFTNLAIVEGWSSPTEKVTDQDPSTVQVARIDLRKQAEGPDLRIFPTGSDVTFEIFVQNTGEVDLTDVAVTDALAPDCAKSIGPLAAGASTTYSCTLLNVAADFTNLAAVEGWYSPTGKVTDDDPSTVQIEQVTQIVQIDIRKQAEGPDSRTFASGANVTFEIFVRNTGDVDLNNVAVTDALAPGCDKSIGLMAFGATATYTCTVQTVTAGFTNIAVVEGFSPQNERVTDEDPSTVQIASIDIRKQAEGPDTRMIHNATDVSYEIFVENTGDATLNEVEVTDEQAPGCAKLIGTLAPAGTSTYTCVDPRVTREYTNTAHVSGTADNIVVTDEDPSSITIQRYPLYFPFVSGDGLTKYNLSIGYEDLELDQQNDFDYNDWVVSIITNLSNSSQGQQIVSLKKIAFAFTPKARGALLSHEFRLKFDANTFAGNGIATVVVRDGLGNILSSHQSTFIGSQMNDFLIFDCTCNAIHSGTLTMNTVEGIGPTPPQRIAEFSIEFDAEVPFVISDYGSHGEGLFFNPYLHVAGSGGVFYDVGIDDVRTLVVPTSSWMWPEEGARIDYAYPGVTHVGPPNIFLFSTNWWQSNNSCVYNDGVVCPILNP